MSHREQDARHQPQCPVCRPLAERNTSLPYRAVTNRSGFCGDAPPVQTECADKPDQMLRDIGAAVHDLEVAQKPIQLPSVGPVTQEQANDLCNDLAALAGINAGYLCRHCCTVHGVSTDTKEQQDRPCTLCGLKSEYTYLQPLSRILPKGSFVASLQAENAGLRQRVEATEADRAEILRQLEMARAERDAVAGGWQRVASLLPDCKATTVNQVLCDLRGMIADAELGALVRQMGVRYCLRRDELDDGTPLWLIQHTRKLGYEARHTPEEALKNAESILTHKNVRENAP